MTRHASFLAASLAAASLAATFAISPQMANAQETSAQPITDPTSSVGATTDLFANLDLPLSLKPQQLTSQWRQINVGSAEESLMQARMYGMGGDSLAYYTRGQTVSIGRETYLVAYRAKPDASRMRTRFRSRMPDDLTPPPKLAFDAPLSLALLNLRTSGNLEDVRAFNPKTDIEKPRERDARFYEQSTSNLKQVGLALAQYIQDWDEVYPPMKSARSFAEIRNGFRPSPPDTAASSRMSRKSKSGDTRNLPVQTVLAPYARDPEIFRHPGTKEIYRPNLYLSHKSDAAIKIPSQMVAFYEARASLDGRRAVLYADGHVKRELETDWPRIKKASHIQ